MREVTPFPTLDARLIWERMKKIEEQAQRKILRTHSNDVMNCEEWATHPLAVEYRSLLKQWWALPTIPHQVMLEIGKANRPMMTRKGCMTTCEQRWAQSIKLTPTRKLILRLSGKPLDRKRRKKR